MAARKTAPKQSTPPADTAPDEATGAVLVVTAPRPRRRAGLAFGREPVRVPVADLSDAELAAIEGDPLLTVKRD